MLYNEIQCCLSSTLLALNVSKIEFNIDIN